MEKSKSYPAAVCTMLPTRLATAECFWRSRISDSLGCSALTLSARVSGYHTGSLQSRGKITTEPKVLPISVLPILRAEFQIVWAARLLLCQQRYQVTKSSRPALFKQRQNYGSELLTDSYLQLYFPNPINLFPYVWKNTFCYSDGLLQQWQVCRRNILGPA